MPIRDLFVIAAFIGSLPFCFLRPWIGILVWVVIGCLNPHRMTWTLGHLPVAQIVAIALIAGMFFNKDRHPLPRIRELYILFALWFIFLLSTLFSVYPDDAWKQFNKVSKMLFLTTLALLLFQDFRKLRVLIWVITLSIGLVGLKGGIWAVKSGGQQMLTGPEGSYIAGNTNLGLALNMILPFLIFLRREETRHWLRHILLAMFFFTIIAVLSTYSRGAAVGLAAVILLLLLKSKFKLVTVPLLLVAIFFASNLLPENWFDKMNTIKTYEEDSSAMNRIYAWQVAYEVALDKPLLGGGFEVFSEEIYYQYLPYETLMKSDIGTGAHSIFFQVLGEHGFTGLFLYVGLILSIMLSLRRMIWRYKKDQSMRWFYNCARYLEVSMVGYIVSGIFLSMCYFDLFYYIVLIVIIMKKLVLVKEREQSSPQNFESLQNSSVRSFPSGT